MIINRIAHHLERAVYLEDSAFRPLATSPQVGHIDDARIEALLARKPSDPHLQFFIDSGVIHARQPLRIPPSQKHQLSARVVIPVMSGSQVLARVWLIDWSPPISSAEINYVHEAVEPLLSLLDESRRERRRRSAHGASLVRGLQNAGRKRRESLLEQLCRNYGIQNLRDVRTCLIRLPEATASSEHAETPAQRPQVEDMVATLMDFLDVHKAAGCVDDRGVQLLMAPQQMGRNIAELVTSVADQAALLHGIDIESIGISGPLSSPHAVDTAFHQAAFSARIASCVASYNGTACWDDLGEHKLFSQVEWTRAGVASLHENTAVLVHDHPIQLASSLLAYLEREGDVEEAARAMNVHRTTLYYRLNRASNILGESATGANSFTIHAALKLAFLMEAHPDADSQAGTVGCLPDQVRRR